MSEQKHDLVDPDIWTVLSLAVSTVSMFAQLAQFKTDVPAKVPEHHSTSVAFEKIRDEIESAIRNCEKLIRVLSNATGDRGNPLDAVFGFGVSRTFFSSSDFQRYGELVSNISQNAGTLNLWALNIIRNDPGFAAEIGQTISAEMLNVHLRINNLFLKRHTNQDVLDECLLMLRSFIQLLARFDRRQN